MISGIRKIRLTLVNIEENPAVAVGTQRKITRIKVKAGETMREMVYVGEYQ